MKSSFVQALVVAFLVSFVSQSSMAGTLISKVNRNQIGLNETVLLTIEYDQHVSDSVLDFDVLENDFDILSLRPQNNSAVTIINGRTTQITSTTWQLTLVPKKQGVLTIPQFSIDGTTSQSINIEVLAVAPSGGVTQSPLEALLLSSSDSAYPNQQLLITVELSAANDVSNLNGSPLKLENAEVELLGQQSFSRLNNGVATQVVELKYLVAPKQAGELVIPPLTFTAIKGAGRSFFSNRGKQVVARTKKMTIPVLPVPASTHPWFPAESVQIRSEWASDVSEIKAGTPVTRSIIITATGQRANVIPPISENTSELKFKSYKDKPQLHTEKTNTGLVATRIESEAIVATSAGEFTLPEIKVDWWDVNAKQWKVAKLPATTLVAAAADVTPQMTSAPPPSVSDDGLPLDTQATDSRSVLLWQVVSALLFAICLAQFWWYRRNPTLVQEAAIPSNKTVSEKEAWNQLMSAITEADAAQVREKILAWSRLALPESDVTCLNSLAARSQHPELQQALEGLDSFLYNDQQQTVDFSLLRSALESLRGDLKTQQKHTDVGALKPLYPSANFQNTSG